MRQQYTNKSRGLTKAQVNRKLDELADSYFQHLKGREKMRAKTQLIFALEKAAWYGALCAARSAELAADRFFDSDWIDKEETADA